jgi:hypothetical protein
MKVLSLAAGLALMGLNLACSSEVPAGSNPPWAGGGQGQAGAAGGNDTPGGGQAVAGGGGSANVGGAMNAGGSPPAGGGNGPLAGAGGQPTAGAGGTAPVAGAGGAGPVGMGKSAGCGRQEPLQQPPREYVQHDIMVDVAPAYQPDYTTREYHTWLPEAYDPNRAYPLYFWGNGCGVSKGNPEGIPVANIEEVRTGALLVFMIQEDGCFDA